MWDLKTIIRMNAEPEETDDLAEDSSLELELYQAKHIINMCQRDPEGFGRDLYRALCNVTWKSKDTGQTFSTTWRYAGGIASTLAYGMDDYMLFYCSGNEGTVTDEVLTELDKLGWEPTEEKDEQTRQGLH